jgi:hypothetical protein
MRKPAASIDTQNRLRIGLARFIVVGLLVAAASIPFTLARADTGEDFPMEMKTTGAPPIDLLYQGKPIDRDDAAGLFKKGVDLSKLSPVPNDTWTPKKLPYTNEHTFNYPLDGSEVKFLNGLAGMNMTRAQVEFDGRPFRLIVNMDNHQALATAALLRTLGYPVDSPRWYKRLRVRFPNAEELQTFVDDCTLETRFSCDRWIVSVDEKNLVVTFKDVNLEYPRVDVQQIYDGQVKSNWVDGRRAMRALLIPLILLDMRLSEDSLNMFPWEFARILGEHVMLSHPSSGAFREATFEDGRWIARKIGLLTVEELRAIVAVGRFPDEVAVGTLLDRVIARRNHLVQIFGVVGECDADEPVDPRTGRCRPVEAKYEYRTQRSLHCVKKGEVVCETFPDYAARFTVGDPESPLRWRELRQYLKMEGIAQGVRVIMNKINDKMQILNTKKGFADHQKKIVEDIIAHFKKNPNVPYVMPIMPWLEPLLGFNVNASRSLVTGTYYGSESSAQLVDNFSIGANVGAFGGIDGRTYLQNTSFGVNAGYQRTYTHVRPIQSLESMKNENWKKLFVPGFMRGAGKILTWKQVKRDLDLFKDAFHKAQRTYLSELASLEIRYTAWEKAHAALVALNDGQPVECPVPPKAATPEEVKLLFVDTVGESWPEDRYPLPSPTAPLGTRLRTTFIDYLQKISPQSEWTLKSKLKTFQGRLDVIRQDYADQTQRYQSRTRVWNQLVARLSNQKLSCDPEPESPEPANISELFRAITGNPWPQSRPALFLSSDAKNPAVLPEDLEDTLILATMRTFLEDVRDNEVFTITDSFVNTVNPQVTIPLTTLAGFGVVDLIGKAFYDNLSPSVGVSLTGQWAVVKRLMILRKGDQIQVYDNKMNTRAFGGGMNFTAWIELAKIAAQKKKGEADTEALMLDLSPITDDLKADKPEHAKDRKKLIYAMADLFFKNEIDTAASYSPAFDLAHKMKGVQKTAKALLWNWSSYAETHKVKVTPPKDLLNRYDREKEARTLYSARKMNLKGKNPYGLLGQVVSKAVGINGLLDSGQNQNPSGTFLGVANWSQVRSEAELTDGRPFKPTITLEDHYSGWYLKKDRLLKILDRLQAEVNDLNIQSPIFRRDMFASTTQLQAYEIRSNVILYPSGVEKLKEYLVRPTSRTALLKNLMELMDPSDYGHRCKGFLRSQQEMESKLATAEAGTDEAFEALEPQGTLWGKCLERWMRKTIRHVRKNRPKESDKEAYVKWLTDTMYLIDKNVDLSRFLAKIGKENFFMQVKVSGFRKGDEAAVDKNQETDYVTDTIGTIQTPVSLGAFRDLEVYSNGVQWNISDYELQARYFGDGL